MTLPDLKKLKAEVKLKKAQRPKCHTYYVFGENLPKVNTEYLIDMMEIIETKTCKYVDTVSPLLFENSNGSIGLIIPVKMSAANKTGFEFITVEDLR